MLGCKKTLARLDELEARVGNLEHLERDVAGVKEALAALKATVRERSRAEDALLALVRDQQTQLAGALARSQDTLEAVTKPASVPTYPSALPFTQDEEETRWQIEHGLVDEDALDAVRDVAQTLGLEGDIEVVRDHPFSPTDFTD